MTVDSPTLTLPVSEQINLHLQIEPFNCTLQLPDESKPRFNWFAIRARIQRRWHKLRVKETQSTQNGFLLKISPSHPADLIVLLSVSIHDQLLEVEISTSSVQIEALAIEFDARSDEHYLGFGERFNRIDQRGNEVDWRVINGASGNMAYKPVPFFMSSAGYGFRLLSNHQSKVRLACIDDPSLVSLRCESNSLHFQVWCAQPYEELLTRYAQLLGLPLYQPPAWIFGPWKSRDWTLDNQQNSLEDIRLPRQLKIPATVKLIDAAWETTLNDFLFNNHYPQPEEMIAEARRLGYRVVLWIAPWMVKNEQTSAVYAFCAENNFLIKDQNGNPYVHRLGNSPGFVGSCFDFTNPQAVEWWQSQIERLVLMGIDGFKTDFGEQVPDDAVFFDGRRGDEMHNLFPFLYNQATYQAMNRHTEGVLLARSAWDGSQKYCAVWAGDQSSDFGPATGMPSAIIAGQNAGLSGFSCWTSDIGGYFGLPTEEVFSRWIAFGAFSPIMQLHGLGCREPWDFSILILEIYKFYARLHQSLFPYIFTFARLASTTGIPVMRAMAFAFPNDEKVWNPMVEYQYMFGSQLLVAPVYFGHTTKRWVHLPPGLWVDFWDGKQVSGGQEFIINVALEQIAVFARAGSIIPMLDHSPDTLLPSTDPTIEMAGEDLRLQIYPGEDGEFHLYDGSHFIWHEEEQSLTVEGVPTPRWLSLRIMGSQKVFQQVAASNGSINSLQAGAMNGNMHFKRFFAENSQRYRVS